MKATLIFTLPEEADDHRAALEDFADAPHSDLALGLINGDFDASGHIGAFLGAAGQPEAQGPDAGASAPVVDLIEHAHQAVEGGDHDALLHLLLDIQAELGKQIERRLRRLM